MILKRFSCEQFAGLSDREFELGEHMNVMIGNNESGKTTMLEMIYHVLNTSVDLKRNEKKDFFDLFLPAEKVTGFSGDCVDGTVVFESENGVFSLRKEWSWEDEGVCRLKSEEGSLIKSRRNVEKKMREELVFGQAVYRNLIFSSQKNKEQILRGILQASQDAGVKEAKGELASRVNRTVMELDGVSIEKLEEEIRNRIAEYESNWDSERKRPKAKSSAKGAGTRWEKNVGKILKSYYEVEDKAREREQAQASEENYERARKEWEAAKKAVREAEEEQKEYRKYVRDIENGRHNQEITEHYLREKTEYEKDLRKWPEWIKRCAKLSELKKEWEHAEEITLLRRRYEEGRTRKQQLEQLQKELLEAGDISSEDYKQAVQCEQERERRKASLRGMSGLKGKIRVKEGLTFQIYEGADSHPVPVEDGEFTLEEAFQITVPGVMDVMIHPGDTEMEDVMSEYQEITEKQRKILSACHVSGMESLQEKYETCENLRTEIRIRQAAFSDFMREEELEPLRRQYEEAAKEPLRNIEEIRRDISIFCPIEMISETIGRMEAELRTLSERYETPEKLAQTIGEKNKRLHELEEERAHIQKVPEKYEAFTDTKRAEEEFQRIAEEAGRVRKERETAFLELERELPRKTCEELEPEYERAREEFERNQEMCCHWKHILEVFEEVKEEMASDPYTGIQQKTKKYLEEMTGGNVTAGGGKGLDIGVVSGSSVMNYRLLSEGTKETTALAFRLAVLEDLYGGNKGFAVFDDSMIDMDPERREAAARILKKFSERYQVIYMTCDPAFGELLGGNIINVF